MNFKIPQDLEIEDKIVGPLTMKGLIIASVGGAISYWAYMKLDDETWPFIVIPVTLITVAIIFVRINNMTFLTWLSALILLFIKPQKRVWQKLSDSPEITSLESEVTIQKKTDDTNSVLSIKQDKLRKLEQLKKESTNL